jgi:ssRNA-specific RNase YbeY (16S rRNA maturation enzyme)
MKKKEDAYSKYYELPNDEIVTEEEKLFIESVDMERIHDLTLQRIHNDNKSKVISFKRSFIKAAIILCAFIGIGTASVYAASNTAIKQVIGNVLGISQTEILTIGETIENKNYRLTVHEYASDSHVGTVIISMEALSNKAKEMFKLNNNILLGKLERVGAIGYGMGFIEELEEENIKYLKINFSASREADYKDGLTFTMEGMRNKIKIPILKTTELMTKKINVEESPKYPANYHLMEYSELGFTLSGTVDNDKMNKNEIN